MKETAKSKQEAARQLVKDFQAAFKRGYSPKDICAILQREGIVISASVIKQGTGKKSQQVKRKSNKDAKN